jgi:hypothetical protein
MRWMTAERTSETAETSDSPDFERPPELPSALQMTLAYHERTKHRPFRFAAALGYAVIASFNFGALAMRCAVR